MSTTYRGVEAKCPFYVQDSAKTIHCEGLTKAETTIRRKFEEDTACTRIFRGYCAGRYTECPIYGLIESVKYGNNTGG